MVKILVFIAIVIYGLGCSNVKTSDQEINSSYRLLIEPSNDSLIPIFKNYYITHNGKKWGVIDSIGNEIIPFNLDGVKQIEAGKGVASIYYCSSSLNTGLPRYSYIGKYFFFTKDGIIEDEKKLFEIIVELEGDNHNKEKVIYHKHDFFLPNLEDASKTEIRTPFPCSNRVPTE